MIKRTINNISAIIFYKVRFRSISLRSALQRNDRKIEEIFIVLNFLFQFFYLKGLILEENKYVQNHVCRCFNVRACKR